MTQQHAPRGRIKARPDEPDNLMSPDDPMSGRCTATSKAKGTRCGRTAIPGGTVCRYHGGAAPQVKAKALERLAALVDPAITRLNELVLQKEYPSTAITAVKDVLDRALGKAAERVDMHVSGEMTLIAVKLEAARKRLAERNGDS